MHLYFHILRVMTREVTAGGPLYRLTTHTV